ncbi:MAG TPA: hypothetical protein PKL84_05355 [Candidatus Hydrogenedentes bacterium]|nr:hypothetical protein [Candidatus Hydrogenedentota bacterium]
MTLSSGTMRPANNEWFDCWTCTAVSGVSVISKSISRRSFRGARIVMRRVSRITGGFSGCRHRHTSVNTTASPDAISIFGPSETICPVSFASCQ